jgi:fructose-1,6-bisphosphatase/inositol monophosphatase family enzyme
MKPPVPAEFVQALAPALRQAAAVARAMEGRVANRPKQGEPSAVKAALTVADTAAQEALLVPLYEHFPQVRVAAEEDTPTVRRFAGSGESLVVVDPIDGTLRFYLEALGPYAVMLGLALQGVYQAALLALPRENLFFSAVRGGGARVGVGDALPRRASAQASGRRVLISHDLPGPAVEVLLAHGYEVAPASGGAIAVAPLLPGVRAGLRYVARGSVSTRGRIGALVSAEAGAILRNARGAPFPDAIEERTSALLVAAEEADMAALLEALAAARSGHRR